MKLIVLVVYPGIKLLDLAGPMQVFNDARLTGKSGSPYRIDVVSSLGKPVITDAGISIDTIAFEAIQRRKVDTVIVIGGPGTATAVRDGRLISGIQKLSRRARRMGAVCTGSFVLAETGLMNGKRAVTHWESCDRLAKLFPAIRVEKEPIFINDDNIWSSAGVTAGIDLALAMVAEDLGRQAALQLAKQLVVYMARPGGQSQFSAVLDKQIVDGEGRFDELHRWINQNLGRNLPVELLAERVNMSLRNFSRVYATSTGQSPARAVEAMRVERAQSLLEQGDRTVTVIARECGFEDDERMRRSFIRLLGVSPSHYRQRFSHVTAE